MIEIKKILGVFLSFVIVSSCSSQQKKTSDETTSREVKGMEIEFNFYPSSGGNAIYRIDCYRDFICVKKLGYAEKEFTVFKKKLTDKEIKRIGQVLSEVIRRQDIETEIILDTWRVELIIDGEIYYNESDVNLNTLPIDIKNLLNLLLENSNITIDLYSFS